MLSSFKNAFKLCKSAVKAITPMRMPVRHYEIPKHLAEVGCEPNPDFFRMVEFFYHSAVRVCEPSLVKYLARHTHLSEKKRQQRVSGILKVSSFSTPSVSPPSSSSNADNNYLERTNYSNV